MIVSNAWHCCAVYLLASGCRLLICQYENMHFIFCKKYALFFCNFFIVARSVHSPCCHDVCFSCFISLLFYSFFRDWFFIFFQWCIGFVCHFFMMYLCVVIYISDVMCCFLLINFDTYVAAVCSAQKRTNVFLKLLLFCSKSLYLCNVVFCCIYFYFVDSSILLFSIA